MKKLILILISLFITIFCIFDVASAQITYQPNTLPIRHNTYDLGTSTRMWKGIYTGNLYASSTSILGTAINSILSTNSSGVITATSTPTFGSFNATSTNATSTIAGHLDITGNLKVSGALFTPISIYSSGTVTAGNFVGTSATASSFAGNVGIGTTSPTAKLDIQGSGANEGINIASLASPQITVGKENGWSNTSLLTWSWNATDNDNVVLNVPGSNAADVNLKLSQSKGFIFNNGNVGIGTTTPSQKLEVYGSQPAIKVDSSANSDAVFRSRTTLGEWGSGTGIGLSQNVWNVYDFGASATRMLINSSGNVGIGTTNPFGKLAVEQTGGNQVVARYNSSNGRGGIYTGGSSGATFIGNNITHSTGNVFNYDTTGTAWYMGNPAGNTYLSIGVGSGTAGNSAGVDDLSTARVNITTSGNVGIGTASPSQKLQVAGSAVIDSALTVGTSLTLGSGDLIYTNSQTIRANTSDGSDNLRVFLAGGGALSSSQGGYLFASGNESATPGVVGLVAGDGGSIQLINGNVGIGTTTPGSQLTTTSGFALNQTTPATNYIGGNLMLNRADSASEFGTSNNFDLHFRTNDTRRMTILSGGNVGIGTTSPAGTLAIKDSLSSSGYSLVINDYYKFRGDGEFTWGNNTNQGILSWDTGIAIIGAQSSNDVSLRAGGAEKVRVTTGGNVGIGTASPTQKLDIAGNVRLNGTGGWIGDSSANAFLPYANASADAQINSARHIILNPISNVGIGTTTPWRTLSVTGTVGFDGLTGSTGAGSLCLDSNKQVVYNSASDSCLPSLRETKNNIADLSINALEVLQNLDPVSFVYNQGDGRTRYGFIAEDTANVNEFLATYNAEGQISGIDDRAVLSVVVKAIKQLINWNNGQDRKIEKLEKENKELKLRLDRLEKKLK